MGYETANVIIEQGAEGLRRYYSSYRGMVVDPVDPKHMNRIKVCVPEVNGGVINWAYPKGQHGSNGDGFKYFTPKMGDIVWVSFEFGDPTKPLWEFHGWGLKQVPQVLDGPNKAGIVTPEGNMIVIDDDNGNLSISFNGTVTLNNKGPVVVNSDQDIMISAEDSIILNDGDNQGLVNIKDLTTKLNELIQELETLRSIFNTHTHPGVQAGPGATSPPATQAATPFSQFVQTDYEDFKIIH